MPIQLSKFICIVRNLVLSDSDGDTLTLLGVTSTLSEGYFVQLFGSHHLNRPRELPIPWFGLSGYCVGMADEQTPTPTLNLNLYPQGKFAERCIGFVDNLAALEGGNLTKKVGR